MGSKYDETTAPADLTPLRDLGDDESGVPYVVLLTGPSMGTIHRLTKVETLIGRSSGCDILVDEEAVSREHAKLIREDENEFLLIDLGSTNGTYKEGQRIEAAVIGEGERFRIGGTTLLRLTLSEEVEESFRKLYDASVRDPLTGLHNRRHFSERLESDFSYALRHATPLSLIMFDIDHFKQVNDTHGHDAGDHVLLKVSEIFLRSIRVEDLVARYGGEEFIIVTPGINGLQAMMLADRIRQEIEALELDWKGEKIQISVSAGIACHMPGGSSKVTKTLIGAADQALYQAKDQGRNACVIA